MSRPRHCSKRAQSASKAVYRSSCRDKYNRPQCDSNLRPVTLQSDALTTRLLRPVRDSKGSPYSITERRVSELILVLGSQPAGDVSHKLGGRLPSLSARPAVTLTTLKRAATSFAAW